jgi:hypothetical protein
MFRAFIHCWDHEIMLDSRCDDNPDSGSQDRNAHQTTSSAPSPRHRVSCRFSFLTEGLTDRLLSQGYGAERALGHSSRFAESGFPGGDGIIEWFSEDIDLTYDAGWACAKMDVSTSKNRPDRSDF